MAELLSTALNSLKVNNINHQITHNNNHNASNNNNRKTEVSKKAVNDLLFVAPYLAEIIMKMTYGNVACSFIQTSIDSVFFCMAKVIIIVINNNITIMINIMIFIIILFIFLL
jgi:hypothetical protein